MPYAPIALFAFKRPVHTRRALEALARNPEFERSPLHIFCDGARRPEDEAAVQATRDVVRRWAHPQKTLHEAAVNRGLAASVIAGVSGLCREHGRVIVVEDDLAVAPAFLSYMNRALERYADEDRVMQISGYMFPAAWPEQRLDAALLPFISSWGWATWSRAWVHYDATMTAFGDVAGDRALRRRFDLGGAARFFAMLKKQKTGKSDSWAIRWYLSVFMRDGLVLFPRHSLVSNEGSDGSGTHSWADGFALDSNVGCLTDSPSRLPDARDGVQQSVLDAVATTLRARNALWNRTMRYLRQRFA